MKAARVKGAEAASRPLAGKTLAMIFDRPSTRTRVSFDVGMRELGGESIMLTGAEMQLGRGETIADTARVLSRYVDAIVIRILAHDDMQEMAAHATVPVINGLTKQSHPCQVLADVMTFEEKRGSIRGRKIAWSGDYNNVLSSWIDASARFDFRLEIACPPELQPGKQRLEAARKAGANIAIGVDPVVAAQDAAAVISDCWVSMGDEDEGRRHNLLAPYQVNAKLMSHAARGRHLHALPARPSRRGGDGRSDRRAAIGRVRRGGKPPARAERRARLVSRSGAMTVLERAASAEVVDDIVLPFAVESLSTRGRLVRLGPAIDSASQAPRLSGSRVEAGGGSGDARRAARLDAEDERPLSVADQERRTRHHAPGRFRRAVAFAGAGAVRQRHGSSAPRRAATCSAMAIWPSPSIRAAT